MGSDVFRMAYRHIRDECEMWSSDEGKLDAKTGVQAPYLSPGFSDCEDEYLVHPLSSMIKITVKFICTKYNVKRYNRDFLCDWRKTHEHFR